MLPLAYRCNEIKEQSKAFNSGYMAWLSNNFSNPYINDQLKASFLDVTNLQLRLNSTLEIFIQLLRFWMLADWKQIWIVEMKIT